MGSGEMMKARKNLFTVLCYHNYRYSTLADFEEETKEDDTTEVVLGGKIFFVLKLLMKDILFKSQKLLLTMFYAMQI